MMRTRNNLCGPVLILVTGCLWGSLGLFIRLMSNSGASAAMISFIRMAFAFVMMLIVTVVRSGFSAFRVSKKVLLFSGAAGLHQLCRAAFFPRAGNRSGADHPL